MQNFSLLQQPFVRTDVHAHRTEKNQFFFNFLFTNDRLCAIISTVDGRQQCWKLHGALAQLVAHNTGSVGVSGSNPLCSTMVRWYEPEILIFRTVFVLTIKTAIA